MIVRRFLGILAVALPVLASGVAPITAVAQASTTLDVYFDSTAQVIRGFGAANIVGWRPDMTEDEISRAFGLEEGDLGFSILRLRIAPDPAQWEQNLATARRAHEMGALIIASPWSPPAHMKTNNNLVGGELREDMYEEYAAHLDSFVSFMGENGAPIYAVSVQNEPDIEVDYESCHWSPQQMLRFMRENAASIGTRVMAPESFNFSRHMSDLLLEDSVALKNLDIVAGHVYGGGNTSYPFAEQAGKEVWMTEYLINESGLEKDFEAVRTIHTSMTSGMSAYVWWYLVRYYGPISDAESEVYQKGDLTRRGAFFSHFSRFVIPGYVRVHTRQGVGRELEIRRLAASAYRKDGRGVIVFINSEEKPVKVTLSLHGARTGILERFVSNETQVMERLHDVAADGDAYTVELEGFSVTTLIADDLVSVSNEAPGGAAVRDMVQNYPNPFVGATTILYDVPVAGGVTVEVLDLLGRRVSVLVDQYMPAGSHSVPYVVSERAPGVYMVRIKGATFAQSRPIVVID